MTRRTIDPMRSVSWTSLLRPIAVAVALVFLSLNFLYSKLALDLGRLNRPHVYDVSYDLPGSRVLRATALNYRTAAADIVWIRAVQFVASHLIAKRTADDVTYYAHTLIDLDPYFYKVYSWHSAARMLTAGYPSPEDIEAANDVLEVGMRYFPTDSQLASEATANYIGFNHGVDRATRIRQLERGIQFADQAAVRANGASMPILLGASFRKRLERLKQEVNGERQDSTGAKPLKNELADPDLLVRMYFQAQTEIVRDSILSRIRRLQGADKLQQKLRAYSHLQEKWYAGSTVNYLPFNLFSSVATSPSSAHVDESLLH